MRYATFGRSGIGHSGAGHCGTGRSGIKTSRSCPACANVAEASRFGEKPLAGTTKVKTAR